MVRYRILVHIHVHVVMFTRKGDDVKVLAGGWRGVEDGMRVGGGGGGFLLRLFEVSMHFFQRNLTTPIRQGQNVVLNSRRS